MLLNLDTSKDRLENNIPIIAIITRLPARSSIILNALVKSITAIVVKGIDKKTGSKGYDDPNKNLNYQLLY
jgi:hypothetical protein